MNRRELQAMVAEATGVETVNVPAPLFRRIADVALAALDHVENRKTCTHTVLGDAVTRLKNGSGES